jgi:hypothetical protein
MGVAGKARDGSRHSFVRCVTCGRTYFAYHSRLRESPSRFCSQLCFRKAWAAFRRALISGQLEHILALPVCQEVIDPNVPLWRR